MVLLLEILLNMLKSYNNTTCFSIKFHIFYINLKKKTSYFTSKKWIYLGIENCSLAQAS